MPLSAVTSACEIKGLATVLSPPGTNRPSDISGCACCDQLKVRWGTLSSLRPISNRETPLSSIHSKSKPSQSATEGSLLDNCASETWYFLSLVLFQSAPTELLDMIPGLPVSLRAWRDRKPFLDPEWYKPWDLLRPFFIEHGYDLFRPRSGGLLSISNGTPAPAMDSFGLYSNREDGFRSEMGRYPLAFAARDRKNRDVVIKVVAKGDEGIKELEILRLLNSEPLKSDPANLTVPILDFLSFRDWQFAVMPFYDGCEVSPFLRASECLDFAEQVLATLAFLHRNHIAHLDITHENILMNHHGKIPGDPFEDVWPPPEFRASFPVTYYLVDFGHSIYFTTNTLDHMIEPPRIGREQRAPEFYRLARCDPFAADVYAAARLFYGWSVDIVPDVPGFLDLLREMSSFNPSSRPSAAMALVRLKALRAQTPPELLIRVRSIEFSGYHLVPRSFLRSLFEIVSTWDIWFACSFTWASFQKWLHT